MTIKDFISKFRKFKIKAPTLKRGVFVLLGVILEVVALWFIIDRLLKPLDDLYIVIGFSVVYWFIVLFTQDLPSTLMVLTLFLFPFNRFLILHSDHAFLLGRISDYLLLTLHVFEIPLFTLFGWKLWGSFVDFAYAVAKEGVLGRVKSTLNELLILARERKSKELSISIILSSLFVFTIFFSGIKNNSSIYSILTYINLFFDFILILSFLSILKFQKVVRIFYISAVIQSVISILQVIVNRSIGLYFLGESQFNAGLFYIAKSILGKVLRVRGYGTFPHPNILGAFIFVSILLFSYDLIHQVFSKRDFVFTPRIFLKTLALSLSLLTLYLTQSRIAIVALLLTILALILLIFIRVFDKKKAWKYIASISLIMIISAGFLFRNRIFSLMTYDRTSITNRVELARVALESVHSETFQQESSDNLVNFQLVDWDKLLFGSGPGGYLRYLSINKPVRTYYSFIVEPVHNVFLLFLSDLGMFGVVFLMLFLFVLLRKLRLKFFLLPYSLLVIGSILFLLFSLNLDHYLVTLKQGVILFGIFSYLIHFGSQKLAKKCP